MPPFELRQQPAAEPGVNATNRLHVDDLASVRAEERTLVQTRFELVERAVDQRFPPGLRRWWLGTAATAVVERALTLGYFVPTMIRLMQAENSPDAAAAAVRWSQLNNFRHLLVAGALLAALKTFSLLYAQRGRTASATT